MGKDGDIIEAKGLAKRFGAFKAVDGIDFSVKAGEIFAFLGPNGAGKTTTIKMLTTLLKPSAGSIRLNGFDPAVDTRGARRSLGIVFQDPSLDEEMTALENLELHGVLYGVEKGLRRERCAELLKVVELWERRDELVKRFSGGMKRRLEIARALLHHPRVLFLDEPTQGLDPQTRNHIWSYISRLRRQEGITVFLTTHYMEEADRVAERLAVIDHGRIVAQGTPAQLKSKTRKKSLEDAFIQITGHDIREDEPSAVDRMRLHGRMWRRR